VLGMITPWVKGLTKGVRSHSRRDGETSSDAFKGGVNISKEDNSTK